MAGERKIGAVVAGGSDSHEGREGRPIERSSRQVRVRRRKWYRRLPPWARDYAVEIGLVVAVLIAIFLLVEPWDIRETLFRCGKTIRKIG